MIICSLCHENRAEEDYNYRNKTLGTRQKACKFCTRKQVQRHYLNNKEYYHKKTRIRNAYFHELIRGYLWDYLAEHPCIDCGETDPVVLEFDHLRDKIIHVSHMAKNNSQLYKVKAEIEKCVVRCANCHRRKTSLERGWYRKEKPL